MPFTSQLYQVCLRVFQQYWRSPSYIAAMSDVQAASSAIVLLFSMMLSFNGVLQPPDALPGLWIFMYPVSPLTYWVGGLVATVLHGREVRCSSSELSVFDPPARETCGSYMASYLALAPGHLEKPGRYRSLPLLRA
ncbi:hypothetical protein B0J12DRAFT_740074 [Macrophomina phaseolina]|uniref:ABC-2 type transporter transmembrane domain-containing protein n=1 Tax=Macrophomina phaseolina TaxID=35725 RepID=A0ABQ8GBQ7_9PEZI|nr:hypothetical protein B0J12DRAFT_740074 [Macrophomina phaseolina]